jgi:hypothetical protein
VTPKFDLGRLLATPCALKALDEAGQGPDFFLAKHQAGDWGDVSESDKRANDYDVGHGGRLISAYKTLKGVKIWLVTEPDRSATTILLPEEY